MEKKTFSEALNDLQAAIGKEILPFLVPVVDWLAKALKKIGFK